RTIQPMSALNTKADLKLVLFKLARSFLSWALGPLSPVSLDEYPTVVPLLTSVAVPSALAYVGDSSIPLVSKPKLDRPNGGNLAPIHSRPLGRVGAFHANPSADASLR